MSIQDSKDIKEIKELQVRVIEEVNEETRVLMTFSECGGYLKEIFAAQTSFYISFFLRFQGMKRLKMLIPLSASTVDFPIMV